LAFGSAAIALVLWRSNIRKTVISLVDHLWPASAYQPTGLDDPEFAAGATALLESIRNLPAKNESQQTIKSQALQLSMELGRARWQLHRWEDSSIPIPFLVILNFWLAILFLMAFASATHDIALDGLYLLALTKQQQAGFVGVQSACFRAGRLLCTGGLVFLAGVLQQTGVSIVGSWTIVIMVLTGLYNVGG
jgi:hypothetical protein